MKDFLLYTFAHDICTNAYVEDIGHQWHHPFPHSFPLFHQPFRSQLWISAFDLKRAQMAEAGCGGQELLQVNLKFK